MSVVSRRIPAVPVRTSAQAWTAIVELVTAPGQPARADLEAISNIAAMLISEEYTRDAPIVFMPTIGPRVRIYTVHGTAAIEDGGDEAPLANWPLVEQGWRVSLPCGIDDIDDVRASLRAFAFVDVRDTTEGITAAATLAPRTPGTMTINYDEMDQS
jgi:hypothetical protein